MNREVAEDIGLAIREVDKTTEWEETEGGSFLRIQVRIDISLPLFRGRIISHDGGFEDWVKFKYERLPNICYWCKCLNHSDIDCDLWIDSNGTLSLDDQEYGPWIRASSTPNSRKSFVVVPGYYAARKKKVQSPKSPRKHPSTVAEPVVETSTVNQAESMAVTDGRAILNAAPLILATENIEERDLGKSVIQNLNVHQHLFSPKVMSPAIQEHYFNAKIAEIDSALGFSDNSKNDASTEYSILALNNLGNNPISCASISFPSQAHDPQPAPGNKPREPKTMVKNTKQATWKRIPRLGAEVGNFLESLIHTKRSGGEEIYDDIPVKRREVSK